MKQRHSLMEEKRVVITGIGIFSPIGKTLAEFWENCKKGANGIGPMTQIDAHQLESRIAGEVNDFNPRDYLSFKDVKRMDRFTQYAMVSALEAMGDAGIKDGEIDPERIGVVLGNGIGGIETLEESWARLFERGPGSVHPLTVPKMITNIAPGNIAIKLQALGPCYAVVSACSSAGDAIGNSYNLVKNGTADVMITGGTEAPISRLAGESV